MTTLTADPVDHWVNITPQPVRQPLLNEMHQAAEDALAATDPLRKAFLTGMHTGYAVGFGLVSREALDRARSTPFASNRHIDFRTDRKSDDEDVLWACGVRHGYFLATSERPDADECVLDGERLTGDDDYEQCFDGKFCANYECFHDWHANGPAMCGNDE